MAGVSASDDYFPIHARLRRQRGPAKSFGCAAPACERQAAVWSWNHTGPSRTEPDYADRVVTWGTDESTYEPLCRHHARMLDAGATFTHCKNGHERAGNTYTDPKGFERCARCKY